MMDIKKIGMAALLMVIVFGLAYADSAYADSCSQCPGLRENCEWRAYTGAEPELFDLSAPAAAAYESQPPLCLQYCEGVPSGTDCYPEDFMGDYDQRATERGTGNVV